MPRQLSFGQLVTVCTGVVALGASGIAAGASAARYPERPVRLLVQFPPGGGSDTVARIISPKLHQALGQQWVIDNRGGAGGNIATEMVARATPDGHTVLLGLGTTLTVNPLLYKLLFHVATDLLPVIMLAAGQNMLVVHPSVTVKTLREFIDLAKAKPGTLIYGSAGAGSPMHLAAELLKVRTGINLVHVPYKGGGPAAAAVVGGEVQVLFGSLPSSFPHVQAGRLKALAVTGPKRAAVAPEIPTIAESGFPGFETTLWYGLLVPAKTPQRVVKTLHDETLKVLQLPDVREHISRQGLEIATKGPREFAAHIKAETAV